MIESTRGSFDFSVVEDGGTRKRATVIIGKEYVQALYNEALLTQKNKSKRMVFQKVAHLFLISKKIFERRL